MEPILEVALCEDDAEDAKIAASYIRNSGYKAELVSYTNGEDFLDSFAEGRFHVVFMDIYMAGISGIETVRSMRKIDTSVLIVFITSSVDHALESYRLGALKYIEKPVTPSAINDCMELAWTLREKRDLLSIRTDEGRKDLKLDSIQYIESDDHFCVIYTVGGHLRVRAKISDLCRNLPPRFVQCHRSYVVNMDHIRRIEQDFIMQNGNTVYISRKNYHKVKKTYLKYLSMT